MSMDIWPRYFILTPCGTLKPIQIPDEARPSRSYPLFAALANVRNVYGVPPIAEPRTLPEDLAPEDAHLRDAFALSLTEMLAYDWMGPAWQEVRSNIGGNVPLHWFTRHFREKTLPALQAYQAEGEVYMLFFID